MVIFKTLKAKICLLGDPSVGKTSLIQRFVFNFFGDVYVRTLGTKISRKVVHLDDQGAQLSCDLTLMIWDIMGQRTKAVPVATYFEGSNGAIIVCDITNKTSFQNLDYWISSIRAAAGDIPILLLANKVDLKDKYQVSQEEFKKAAKERELPFLFSSAKTKNNVEEAFTELGRLILSNQLHPNFGLTPAPEQVGEALVSKEQEAHRQASILRPTPVVASTDPQLEITPQPMTPTPKQISPPSLEGEPSADTSPPSITSTAPSGPSHEAQAPVRAPTTMPDQNFAIKANNIYLIKEERPQQSFNIFHQYLARNVAGLCISRTHPNKVASMYGIKDGKVLWLTTDSTGNNTIAPIVTKLNMVIIDFIQRNERSVILLEGLEYLIHQNDFKTVLNLIYSINDKVMVNDCRMIIPLDPLVLEEKLIHQLTRDMIVIQGQYNFTFS